MYDGLSAAGESGRGNVICANRKPMLSRRIFPQPLAASAVVTGAFAAGPVVGLTRTRIARAHVARVLHRGHTRRALKRSNWANKIVRNALRRRSS
jgi:hypothetical protein